MIQKTQGISLSYIKYKDTSIIAKVFTRDFGPQSLLINGIRSSKSKNTPGYFEPFSHLELVLYYNKAKDIHRVSEYKLLNPNQQLRTDLIKSTVAIFLAEVLGKVLKYEEAEGSSNTFEFIQSSIAHLCESQNAAQDFHIQFLMRFMSHQGYEIQSTRDLQHAFDLCKYTVTPEIDQYIAQSIDMHHFHALNSSGQTRSKVLDALIKFLQLQTQDFFEVKSLAVLQQVFK